MRQELVQKERKIKITDPIIILHERESLQDNYQVSSQTGGGLLQLLPFGVMTIETDEGVSLNAFLGSVRYW